MQMAHYKLTIIIIIIDFLSLVFKILVGPIPDELQYWADPWWSLGKPKTPTWRGVPETGKKKGWPASVILWQLKILT